MPREPRLAPPGASSLPPPEANSGSQPPPSAGRFLFSLGRDTKKSNVEQQFAKEAGDVRDAVSNAIGFDMFSEANRCAAMERVRDSGAAALTIKVVLRQEGDAEIQAGSLLYLPLYADPQPHTSGEQV